jgi:hypothetical protein
VKAVLDVRQPAADRPGAAPAGPGRLDRFDVAALVGLFVLAFVPRIAWRAEVPTEWDSVQFVLGVTDFDVTQGRPHPPGYWLLILSGRLVRAVTGLGPHGALLLVAAAASALTAAVGYLLGRALRCRAMGLALGLILATAPLLSFYGTIANSYSVEACGGAVLALVAVSARPGGRHHIGAALALAAVAGFRPSAFVLFLPVAVVAVLRTRRDLRGVVTAAAVFAVAVALWAVPEILEQPGGLDPILRENRELWEEASQRTSIVHGASVEAWARNMGRSGVLTFLSLLPALVAVGAALVTGRLSRRDRPARGDAARRRARPEAGALVAAVAPGLLIAVFVHFGKEGYVLTYLPALLALVLVLVDWDRRRVAGAALAVTALFGVYELRVFDAHEGLVPAWVDDHVPIVGRADLGSPYRLTRHTLRLVDRDARAYLDLRTVLDPSRDAIVCEGDEGATRFRQLGYELPEFVIHMVNPGQDIFRMRDNRWSVDEDQVLEVPPGGRAVFVFNAPPPEILDLVARGLATAVPLPSGPTAWAVPAGVSVFGVTVTATPDAGTI